MSSWTPRVWEKENSSVCVSSYLIYYARSLWGIFFFIYLFFPPTPFVQEHRELYSCSQELASWELYWSIFLWCHSYNNSWNSVRNMEVWCFILFYRVILIQRPLSLCVIQAPFLSRDDDIVQNNRKNVVNCNRNRCGNLERSRVSSNTPESERKTRSYK